MRDLPRFIKIGMNRINVDEIVSYGIGEDWGDDDEIVRYLYIETKTSEELFEYPEGEEEVDFDIDEKIAELDDLFLIKKIGSVDFK